MNQKASFACIETNDKNLQAFSSDHGQSFVHIRIETLLFWFNILWKIRIDCGFAFGDRVLK